jgi:DNA-binding NarL/FixJ family response regulator
MASPRLSARAIATARAARLKVEMAEEEPAAAPGSRFTGRWGLSPRELEVLAMLADGRTNRQIGEALFITDKTASVHVTHIMDKLGVSRRTEAAILAVRAGLGRPDGEIRGPAAAE